MNAPAIIPADTLPSLIDKATQALDNARSSAEVLEARDMARVAYDAAKSAGRMAKAKKAHDSLVSEVHRSQAHALAIRARAEMRLAEEYDAAQERGEVASNGYNQHSDEGVAASNTLELRRDEIHEARKLRDAETESPGLIQQALNAMVDRGEEPTRAALKREVVQQAPRPKQMDKRALWLWGRIKDFERMGVLTDDPSRLLEEMTEPMREDVRRLAPALSTFIKELTE